MFQIDKAPPEKPSTPPSDGTKGLACPQASELPHSLMDEYQALLSSPSKLELKPIKKISTDVDFDLYQILGNSTNNLAFESVKHGSSPGDPNAVLKLYDQNLNRSDSFLNGVRQKASFLSNKSTDSKIIAIDAKIKNESGQERITSESGYVMQVGVPVLTGQFEATFDASGKLASYKAGPNFSSMVDQLKNCTHK